MYSLIHRHISAVLAAIMLPTAAFAHTSSPAQEADTCIEVVEATATIQFRISNSRINPALGDNAAELANMDSVIAAVNADTTALVSRVTVSGSASPEGPESLNIRLSHLRAKALKNHYSSFLDNLEVPVDYNYAGPNWEGLRQLVLDDETVPDRFDIINIIDSEAANRLQKLKRLSGGATYRWLLKNLYPKLRSSTLEVEYTLPCIPDLYEEGKIFPDEVFSVVDFIEEDTIVSTDINLPADTIAPEDPYIRRLYFKTNAAAWAMAISNLAFEIDIIPHLSVTLPLYYSAWEYGSEHVKFRTCAFEPEVRGWLRPDNSGLFAGAHFGVAQYNMAIGGPYRFQDHNGHSPALGGGLSLGYRCFLGHSRHWMMEFTVGAGVYHLNYDVFDNSSVRYGRKLYQRHKAFTGIDNVGITFIYALPLNRKGGAL